MIETLPALVERRMTFLDGGESCAFFSKCEQYRYFLTRRWSEQRLLTFIMLNPSTATEEKTDATIERCARRAQAWGFGGIAVMNLFAFRATDPADMKRAADPVGPNNDSLLRECIRSANTDQIVCGWGVHGSFLNRERAVFDMFREWGKPPMALGWTKDGHPKHPLYISYQATLEARP